MNKLKILFGLSTLLIAIQLFYFLSQLLFFESISALFIKDTEYTTVFQNPRWWIIEIIFTMILLSSCFIAIGLWSGIRNGLFTDKAVSYLRIGSRLLLGVGAGTLLISLLDAFNSVKENSFFMDFMVSVLIIMLGYLLLLFVDVIQKGIYFKKKNDLTI
ncbi:hypothetical protein [Nonlabens antarcticus]|uniref:hypothetical protein n=1 Tax=Nonlabens antarcticus TaxID=392714 RepID=UPI00189193E0|nr:hypothetical protein [Nonlabens antarcticus]